MKTSSPHTTTVNTSPAFAQMLFIAFLVLKLTHVIDWSWWWVFAPLYGGFLFLLGIIMVFGIVIGVAKLGLSILDSRDRKRRRARMRRLR